MNTDTICLDSLEVRPPDVAVPLDVEVYLPPDDNGARYIRRKRWRTHAEIFNDFHKALDIRVCDKCGHETDNHRDSWRNKTCQQCGQGENQPLVDEYDSNCCAPSDEHKQVGTADEWLVSIACYAEVGGNEGYSAKVTLLIRNGKTRDHRYLDVYRIKSFAGMDHVYGLVKRLMIATGVWPDWCLNRAKAD